MSYWWYLWLPTRDLYYLLKSTKGLGTHAEFAIGFLELQSTLTILLSVLVLLNDLVWNFSKNLYETYRTIQNFWVLTAYRTVSIKRPGLIFFLKILVKNIRMFYEKGFQPIMQEDPTFYGILWKNWMIYKWYFWGTSIWVTFI